MDFFQKHDKALRRGRLLQTSASLLAGLGIAAFADAPLREYAVDTAFNLERMIESRLAKEEEKK
jgi:hypothetical protein